MAKKITLQTIAAEIAKLNTTVERGFAAVADDISKLATKDQVIGLHTQVNSIETQLRGMSHDKLETRVTRLEENVLGHQRR
jgi:hypothetical protein